MNPQEIIKKEIERFNKMIEFAERQDSKNEVSMDFMREQIGFNHAEGLLCEEYSDNFDCEECPLYKQYGTCNNDENTRNLWGKIDNSKTWGEWIINAKAFVKQLGNLL